MNLRDRWAAWSQTGPMRTFLVGLGFFLIALTPFVGPIPGPGGIIVFGAGLTLVLKYSGWAKRVYVRLKRKHPKKGAWADWSLRRQSAQRRHALMKERESAEQAATMVGATQAEIGEAQAGPGSRAASGQAASLKGRPEAESAEAHALSPDPRARERGRPGK
jgi:hypothetical protein